MTRDEFRAWAKRTVRFFHAEGPASKSNREWADKIRPFDAPLADLYLRVAEANEAVREHLEVRFGRETPPPKAV